MRYILLFCLGLAACSRGPQTDLPTISEARSLGAEWALVNEQASQGKLTQTYSQTMRKQLRQQLQAAAKSLTRPESRYGREVQALLAEPADASPAVLRAHAATLKQIEDGLESA
ncbi:MAG TPA: hypothetical protein VF098_08590 [Sphingomicrobium sp.]|jgi:hypothetical protein